MVQKLHALISGVLSEPIEFSLEPSERLEFGHYATNVALQLARRENKDPRTVAQALAVALKSADTEGLLQKVEAAGPGFLNFWFSKDALDKAFRAYAKIKQSGHKKKGRKPVVLIDYSHPNIAKPMGIHHLRTTIIGAALVHIFKFLGWKVITDNHLGDWGKQFGILIAAYKERKENGGTQGRKLSIQDLLELYVDYNTRMKADPALEARARQETKKLQDGDPENTRIWKQFYKVSLDEFKKFYKRLNVSFDYYLGESFYKNMLPGVVAEALDKEIAVKSEGATIIPLENLPPFVIQKSDEAFLYSTTDIAAVKYRRDRFKPDLVLYVVANEQALHFEQLFKAVEKLGYRGTERLEHVKFGMVLGEDMKKLSTRAGRGVSLEAVLDEAIARARAIVDEKRKDLSERERKNIAQTIGIAAIKYNDLSQNRQSDIAFQWDKMLNFEGNSAPYLLYSYARMKSILRKGGRVQRGSLELPNDTDRTFFLKVLQFDGVLARVERTYFPHLLADYLYGLAKHVNAFYEKEPVLSTAPNVRVSRLALIRIAAETMNAGLALLGIGTVEKM